MGAKLQLTKEEKLGHKVALSNSVQICFGRVELFYLTHFYLHIILVN